MKYTYYIVCSLVVVSSIFVVFTTYKNAHTKNVAITTLSSQAQTNKTTAETTLPSKAPQPVVAYCFKKEIPHKTKGHAPDIEEVTMLVAEDGKFTGTYNVLPSEKDGARGTLTGVSRRQEGGITIIDATYHYTIEGSEQEQEWRATTGANPNSSLSIGHGPLVEVPGKSIPTLVFKNKDTLTYTNTDALLAIPCDTVQN
jgi:hypothetical protein